MYVVYIVTIESFHQLLREEGIQDTPLASNPPVLQSIANKVCEWKQLARFLGLDEPTIKTIEWNYSRTKVSSPEHMDQTKWKRCYSCQSTTGGLL